MEDFKQYIMSAGDAPLPEIGHLEAIVKSYPWFMTARMVLEIAKNNNEHGGYMRDSLLALHLTASPTPSVRLHAIKSSEYDSLRAKHIIDSFLVKGEHRIVPGENTTEEDVTPVLSRVPDIVTEELADIYMKQQLWGQAKEVYEKLILLYPKKSVYFAEIIGKIDNKIG